MGHEAVGVTGRLMLEVLNPAGQVVRRRVGSNKVLQGGRALLAQLLAGQAYSPTFHIAVGLGRDETRSDMTELAKKGAMNPVVVKKPQAKDHLVLLKAAFPPAPEFQEIAEAGVLITCKSGEGTAEQVLYNRVKVDPPLELLAGETLTTSWELSFSSTGEEE